MPTFGSIRSGSSPRKMEGRFGESGAPRFNLGHIVGDPFALATISIAIVAWLIAFISSIIADVRDDFPNFAWWALVFMLCCILGVTVAVAADAEDTYSVAISAFLGAGLVFTSSAVNSLIYTDPAAKQAAAAGFILLSMVAVVWVFYYGSKPDAASRMYIDSFALHKAEKQTARHSRSVAYGVRQENPSTAPPQMYTSAQLNGFETSSPVSGYPGGPVGSSEARNSQRFGTGNTMGSATQATEGGGGGPTDNEVQYPYRAKAIYSYEANPDDANEISFTKHEILDVSDVSGRWWQARKANGETGIAPSNYLILL